MERSISGLAYKGSITEAILVAQQQKKLLVVYLAGADADSAELEKSTWTDPKVAESVSKCCVLLHIKEGSSDAANFSAIYPQNSVPSIAAIGYNGVQVWQNEGFVSAEVLASSLEKAWLSLHIQETTATVLTAALASKKYEPSASGSSVVGTSEQGSSLGTAAPSPSTDKEMQSSEAELPVASEMIKANNSDGHLLEENNSKLDGKTASESSDSDKFQSVGDEDSSFPNEEAREIPSKLMVDPDCSGTEQVPVAAEDGLSSQEKSVDNCSGVTGASATAETNEAIEEKKADRIDVRQADTLDNNARENACGDVHLNIRLPDGVSLKEKFSVTSNLGMVKDYVDRNQASSIGSYDLAIPYPRKVFSDEDLSKLLSELGLSNRQALIVVPRQRATSYHRGVSSSSAQMSSSTNADSSNSIVGGYFSHVRRLLSFINPLSYLGGGASSTTSGQAQSTQSGMWEYSPNPALQNRYARMERPSSGHSPNESTSTSGRNDSTRRQNTSRFGSNIHTLKHDEDDRFSDRNSFWNGNSTEFGGNNDNRQ
ncbi:hypothetical protein Tsubulata_041221 [Turnera subulata]|uniref:UBX domain-containing protein n=1 Tax=Turnera subulata TaxID=218843 RepID=A0A9Q0JE01_9ROSI|nr:hypothetical protein Tsubulata_041221 [Turnera subulata]